MNFSHTKYNGVHANPNVINYTPKKIYKFKNHFKLNLIKIETEYINMSFNLASASIYTLQFWVYIKNT